MEAQPVTENLGTVTIVIRFRSPHSPAQRTSVLNFFLYLRISGESLCGRMLVGLTLTTEPFLWFSLLIGSPLLPAAGGAGERETKQSSQGVFYSYSVCVSFATGRWIHSLGLSGGDDMGINLGSMKERKEEDEDEEAFFPVGLPTG